MVTGTSGHTKHTLDRPFPTNPPRMVGQQASGAHIIGAAHPLTPPPPPQERLFFSVLRVPIAITHKAQPLPIF